jgi:hypothetical protein
MAASYLHMALSQQPIRVSVLSHCSATDISVLEKLQFLTLSKVERTKYLNPIRDIPCCNWILERVERKDRVMLIGSDLKALHDRISDPFDYERRGSWQRILVLWVAVIPDVVVRYWREYTQDTTIVTDSTTMTSRLTTLDEMNEYFDSGQVESSIDRAHELGIARHDELSDYITSFVASPDILSQWRSGEDGWMVHSETQESKVSNVRMIEYHHDLRRSTDNSRCVSTITNTRDLGCLLLSDRNNKGAWDASDVHTFYSQIDVDPFAINLLEGVVRIGVPETDLVIMVERYSDMGRVDEEEVRFYIRVQ